MKGKEIALSVFLFSCCAALLPPPPCQIPPDLIEHFTMQEKVPYYYWCINDAYSSDTPLFYSTKEIDDNIEEKIQKNICGYYIETDIWLYQALKKYPIEGKDIVIIGSTTPWYESVVIAYGGHPFTIDYNPIVSDDPRIHTMTVDEYNKNPRKFDVLLSISSIEHDGLGRYGDPINPNADLEFMTTAKQFLKEGGMMIFAVPVGRDALIWNACRIYGPLRFPLLLKEWDIIDSFGFSGIELGAGNLFNYTYQPIFCLTPKVQ